MVNLPKFIHIPGISANKIVALLIIGGLTACSGRKSERMESEQKNSDSVEIARNTYAYDQAFLQRYHPDLIELKSGSVRVLVCPAYQGRVMTSTADGKASYGWINYDLIQSGTILPHMNAFGGEDRFWLGPEGGQYALFFKKGDPFDGEHWQTPAAIDSEPFTVVGKTERNATFSRDVVLTNYAGHPFSIGIERSVSLLTEAAIHQLIGVRTDSLKMVGIRSDNTIRNKGEQAWTVDTGMPSIWILGMMNASSSSTIIIPFRPGAGKPINDNYFGKVPADRLIVGKQAAFFRADANYRSKIGVSPIRAAKWIGSYDPATQTLTVVTFSFDPRATKYVNSAWEVQKEPFAGDVINAYNDGPMKPGQPQMGKFYEMESSSPAAALQPGSTLHHQHTTIHIQGLEKQLNELAKKLLQTDLADIR